MKISEKCIRVTKLVILHFFNLSLLDNNFTRETDQMITMIIKEGNHNERKCSENNSKKIVI